MYASGYSEEREMGIISEYWGILLFRGFDEFSDDAIESGCLSFVLQKAFLSRFIRIAARSSIGFGFGVESCTKGGAAEIGGLSSLGSLDDEVVVVAVGAWAFVGFRINSSGTNFGNLTQNLTLLSNMSSTIRCTLDPRCGFLVRDSLVYPAVAMVCAKTSFGVPFGSNKPGDDMGVIRMLLMELAALRFFGAASVVAAAEDVIGSFGDCRRFMSLVLLFAPVDAAGFGIVIFGLLFWSLVVSEGFVSMLVFATFVEGGLVLIVMGLGGLLLFGLRETEAIFALLSPLSVAMEVLWGLSFLFSFLGFGSCFGDDSVTLNLPPRESFIRFLW
mmetsp:Transcript_11008/g.27901  ORF Transcript_11008/g.27901 Transcript_11008/m.27901 type:complete len:330 (-) Transcript_11008:105-1094(-)